MNIENAVDYVHSVLSATLKNGDAAIDATVGNGWDTAYMANIVGAEGVVYGFDIQPIAIEVARVRTESSASDVQLYLESHANMMEFVASAHHGKVHAIAFNLGYLPGGDKDITTHAESTVNGLMQAKELIAPSGVISVVCYRHAEGERELNVVRELLSSWSQTEFTVMEISFINQAGQPPVVFTVYKRPH